MIFSEDASIILGDAFEVPIHGIDLLRDTGIAAGHALELLPEFELESHLGTVLNDDTATITVDTHHGRGRDSIQSPGVSIA